MSEVDVDKEVANDSESSDRSYCEYEREIELLKLIEEQLKIIIEDPKTSIEYKKLRIASAYISLKDVNNLMDEILKNLNI